jgi:biopolymer transport protein ExbB/TolQ
MAKNIIAYILLTALIVIITITSYDSIIIYYKANASINGIILLTLIIGFLLYSYKIFSLSSEYRFMNSVAFGKLKLNDNSLERFPLTKKIAQNLGITSSSKSLTKTLEEILDELLSVVESGKDISKYLINLAVFLGLIGTFYGLLLTIGSVSNVIDGLSIEQQDFGVFFNTLRDGLKSPLSGMTIAFSSSLFGLVTSLILGLYEIIIRGVKQSYYEFCENQIRLYFRSATKQISSSSSDGLTDIRVLEKLDQVISELKSVTSTIKNLDK